MRTLVILVAVFLVLAGPSGTTWSQESQTVCFQGTSTLMAPDGTPYGVGGELIRRTLNSTDSQINEETVTFASPLGEPPTAVQFISTVVDNHFTFSIESAEGRGDLIGEPWAWTSWTTELTVGGVGVLSNSELSAEGLLITSQVVDGAGNVVLLFEDRLTPVDCSGWDELQARALVGELTVAEISPDTPDDTTEVETAGNYREEDVVFDAGGLAVHGTVTYPLADGSYPAVMLIAGSGPTDRDWNNPYLPGTNGSARLLAHVLAESGYVVLRYDKLGTGETVEIPPEVASGASGLFLEHIMAEQIAGLRLLESNQAVDSAHIFVAGSSEGGVYALRLAEEPDLPLAGVITLAGGGRPQGPAVARQIHDRLTEAGMFTSEEVNTICDTMTAALDNFVETGEVFDPAAVSDIEGIQDLLAAYVNPASIEWARWILSYDPAASFARFDIPVLILQGEKDIQVSPELDAQAMYDTALAAGRTNVTLVLAPNADHVLKYEETPFEDITALTTINYNADGRILDPDVVNAILRWLAEQTAEGE